MTIFRPKPSKKDETPPVVLRCNGANNEPCAEREQFLFGTSKEVINHWAKRHGWRVTSLRGKYTDQCPICERLARAPAGYFKWAVNG